MRAWILGFANKAMAQTVATSGVFGLYPAALYAAALRLYGLPWAALFPAVKRPLLSWFVGVLAVIFCSSVVYAAFRPVQG